MAIHKTLKILTTKFPDEPAHIFTDCLNCIYLIKTYIKYPTAHRNHADKNILNSMINLLQNRTTLTTIHKAKAHTKILGNKQADKLAKHGNTLTYRFARKPMNMHIPHHTTTKKTNGQAQPIDQIRVLSDASTNISKNLIAKIT